MSALGGLLVVLLDESIDVLAAIATVVNLDEVPMVAHINARTSGGVKAVDVDFVVDADFGMASGNAPGRLITDPTH